MSVHFGEHNFVAQTAFVCGDVRFGDHCSVWPGVVIRADIAPIRIGTAVNIQDGTIIHTRHDTPLDIEDRASFGHRAVVHCRRIGQGTLVGIGAIVLDDCEIGPGCLIAAGTVLPPGTAIPAGKLVVGVPGRVVRDLDDRERDYLEHVTRSYIELGQRHRDGEFPPAYP